MPGNYARKANAWLLLASFSDSAGGLGVWWEHTERTSVDGHSDAA